MIIRVKNLQCETVIGVYEQEKTQKQPILINLRIKYDEGKAPTSDNINDTINYHLLVDKIKSHVENNKFELVERVVEEVGQIVMQNDKVISCKVEVDKHKGPLKYIDSFSVSKSFKRK
jgi:D-erythro-7,8-dihydroneopterin triphosphate epimerase